MSLLQRSFELAVEPNFALRAVVRQEYNASKIAPNFNSKLGAEALSISLGTAGVTGYAPNGVVTMKYPYKGNEKAIGHQLFQKDDQFGYLYQ